VLSLFSRHEVEEMAREAGFYRRKPKGIKAFEFVLCCALGAIVEQKRGFASVWRILIAVAGVHVARSAVTQRFSSGSAALLEAVFFRALERLPSTGPCIDRAKLNGFREVLAQDGTVLKLAPMLKTLFPATRTNVVEAAAKAHIAADLRERRIVDVTVTGERDSELNELYKIMDFKPGMPVLVRLGLHQLRALVAHQKEPCLCVDAPQRQRQPDGCPRPRRDSQTASQRRMQA
jgi:hypothetical protein